MQYSQKNFMSIIGNDQKNDGQNFWEILERIIGKISSIVGVGLHKTYPRDLRQMSFVRHFSHISFPIYSNNI